MLLSRSTRDWLLLAFFIFMPVEVWGVPTKSVEIRLDSTVTVVGESVVLGDVAVIYAKSLRDFNALSNLVLTQFPADQGELRLPGAYLTSRIREALPEGAEFKLIAPAEVTFRMEKTEKVGLGTNELIAELSRRARSESRVAEWAELVVEPVGGFDSLKTAKLSDLRIEPASEMARWKGDMTFKVSRAGVSEIIWVRTKFRWFALAWVAKRRLGALQSVTGDDFETARVEVTSLRDDPLLASSTFSETGTSRLRRSIEAGAALPSAALERAPDVRTGQPLRVVFISESGIRVSTEGASLAPATIGSEARAKLRTSRKVVSGRLVSGSEMEVSL